MVDHARRELPRDNESPRIGSLNHEMRGLRVIVGAAEVDWVLPRDQHFDTQLTTWERTSAERKVIREPPNTWSPITALLG